VRSVRVFFARLRGLGRAREEDADLRAEIEAHLEEATEELVRQGMAPDEARRVARLRFGSVESVAEECRDLRGRWLEDLARDLAHGWRLLLRDRAFAAVAILSLALGIGANSAIFSIVNSMLLRPRPVADPARLAVLYAGDRGHPYETTSYPSYLDLRRRNEVFTDLAAYSIFWQARLGDANEVEHVWGEVVSSNYFDVLGVRLHEGRGFVAEDSGVVVLSHALWQRRFHADPALVGKAVTINNRRLTVAGIAPPEYRGMMGGVASDVWIPITTLPTVDASKGTASLTRDSRWLTLVGRLRPGVTIEQAKTHFAYLSRQMQEAHPEEWRSREETGIRELFVTVLPERDTRVHPQMLLGAYAIAGLLFAVVNLVLLIACMNLAGMLLARAVVRRKEIAVRLALGANRGRIIRQLIAESVLLSTIAGALGVLAGIWLLDLLLAFMPAFPEGIRLAIDLQLDWRVLVFAIGFSTATGVLFGLAPALHASRTEVSTALKDNSVAAAPRRSRIRAALIVTQVGFSLLLLIAAGLVLRSLEKVRPTRLGFPSENVVVATLNLDEHYDRGRSQELYRRLLERIGALPGVQTVTLVDAMPGGFLGRTRRSIEIEGYVPGPSEDMQIDSAIVGPRYFTNLGIPIVQGRDFDGRDREGAPCVAIVNEAFVRRYLSGRAFDKRLVKGRNETRQSCSIAGVVRDERWQSLQEDVRPFYWMPVLQSHATRMMLLAGTEMRPAAQIGAVRRVLRELDPNMPLADIQTLGAYFQNSGYPFRLLGFVFAACGVAALVLATIGVYGLVSYTVVQRTREIGIRIALGATRRDVISLVVGGGMALVGWGLALGLLLSLALTRVLASSVFGSELLFGVSALDSLTFVTVALLLAGVAFVASCVPALRATRVDPMVALRYE
jgi:predicted permease